MYHALCRNKRGHFTETSACSLNFLTKFRPLSAHYSKDSDRYGTFMFLCTNCEPVMKTAKTSTHAAVQTIAPTVEEGVINVTQALTAANLVKLDESLAGELNNSDHIIDVDNSSSGSESTPSATTYSPSSDSLSEENTPLIGVQKMFNRQQIILEKIESLVQSSSKLETSMEQQFNSLKHDILQGQCIPQSTGPASSSPISVLPAIEESHTQPKSHSFKPFKNIHGSVLNDELKNSTLRFLDNLEGYKTLTSPTLKSSRDVSYFGEFSYRYGNVEHEAKAIPEELKLIMEEVKLLYPESVSNSCLVTRYKTGQNGIPQHHDHEPFLAPWADIFTLSLGSKRNMSFTCSDGKTESAELPDNSLLVFSRASQETWSHGIKPDTSTSVRYSLTFRQLAPYYLNSTAVFGDSNTSKFNFGTGRKTFGKWLPGMRTKAGTIGDIPEPTELFPYRNVVFHTGINDLRGTSQPPDIRGLASSLLKKCKTYTALFPRMRVHVSLLLPTKNRNLNNLVNQFNSIISSLVQNEKNITLITHNNIAFSDGCMRTELGRTNRDGSPNLQDDVHLGYTGIAQFSQNVKNCIIRSKHTAPRVDTRDNGIVKLPDSSQSKYPYFTPNPAYNHPNPNSNVNRPQRNLPNQWLQPFNVVAQPPANGSFGLNIPTYSHYNDGYQFN